MLQTIRPLLSIFLAIALLMAGNGLQASILGIRADIESFSDTAIGLITSGYFLGFLFASLRAPAMIRSVGHIRVFAAFASLCSVSILFHSMIPNPFVWFFLRLLTGFSIASLYVVIESWINQASTNETRGQLLSIYMVIVYGFMAFGQLPLFVLPAEYADPSNSNLFMAVSIIISLALVPVSLTRAPAPVVEDPQSLSLRELYSYSPFGVVGCFVNGIAQSCIFGLSAVFGISVGLSVAETAILSAVPFLMGGILQFPIGAMSDKMDRRLTAAGLGFVSACIAAMAAFFLSELNSYIIIIFVGLYGGVSSIIYSIIIAHVNDVMPQEKMLAASARLVLLFGIGSVIGPSLVGYLMQNFGAESFLWFGGAVYLFIGLYAIYRITRRSVNPDERGDYVFVAARATSIAAGPMLEEAAYSEDDIEEDDEEAVAQIRG